MNVSFNRMQESRIRYRQIYCQGRCLSAYSIIRCRWIYKLFTHQHQRHSIIRASMRYRSTNFLKISRRPSIAIQNYSTIHVSRGHLNEKICDRSNPRPQAGKSITKHTHISSYAIFHASINPLSRPCSRQLPAPHPRTRGTCPICSTTPVATNTCRPINTNINIITTSHSSTLNSNTRHLSPATSTLHPLPRLLNQNRNVTSNCQLPPTVCPSRLHPHLWV